MSNRAAQPTLPDPLQKLLPLSPTVVYILMTLSEGEQHGYAIMQSVQSLSEGRVSMGPATLYSTIQRLLNLGLIEETTAKKQAWELERNRRYYQLSSSGRMVLDEEARRLQSLLRRLRLKRLVAREAE